MLLAGNYGQHMAIMAGFEHSRGRIAVTLDADLQNPPEEIGALVAKMNEGYDYVGTIRKNRQDSMFRRLPSRIINVIRERTTQHTALIRHLDMRGAFANNINDAGG